MYEPGEQLPDVIAHIGALLEVHVLADHLTLTNPQVKANRLWGHLKYTADSDVVAMLHHSGKFELKEQPPADIFGVRVFFRIGEGLPEYDTLFSEFVCFPSFYFSGTRAAQNMV